MNSLDNLYMAAVKAAKETEEFVGGFDIMQKLQKKLHKEQQEPLMTPIEENPPRERYPEEKDE